MFTTRKMGKASAALLAALSLGTGAAFAQQAVVVIEAEPTSMDPHNTTDSVSATVQGPMFEGLLRFDDSMSIVPVLATGYSYSDDATAITFELQQGVTFHDGAYFNAEVVKMNLDFVRDADNGLARRSFFRFIEDVIVEDDYTVTITSESPNSAMASYMAHTSAAMKSPRVIERKMADPDFNADREGAVGTGPFQFVEWRDGVQTVVEAFDGYWNADNGANVERIVFRPVQEASTRINMLQAGEAHLVFPIPTLFGAQLESDDRVNLRTGPTTDVHYIGMNLQLDKYQDVKVRQALNFAIDKDGLIAQMLDGYGTIADSAIAPNVYGYAAQEIYDYDMGEARALLAEAGYAEGFTATLWTRNSTEFIAVAEYVAIQLGELGIEVTVEAYESGTLFDMLDAGEGTDLFIGRWSPGTGEADYGLRPNFASDRVPPNFNNSGFYVNEAVDDLLNRALASSDAQEALSLYAEVQEVIYDEAPWVFLHIPESIVGSAPNLDGVYVLPSGNVHVSGISLN